MGTIQHYHRPTSLSEALQLLARATPPTRVLAGGTTLVPDAAAPPHDVVDLQALGLDGIDGHGEHVEIGAMVRLQDLVEHDAVPELVRELARREGPNTLRNAATVGGTIAAADPESELVAGLLVHDATVHLTAVDGTTTVPLAALLADRSMLAGAILTSVEVAQGGAGAAARTGRTPADRSIVAAVARRGPDEVVRLALTGVAPTPVLVASDALAELDPPADFRGSGSYRRHLAEVLAARALGEIGVPA